MAAAVVLWTSASGVQLASDHLPASLIALWEGGKEARIGCAAAVEPIPGRGRAEGLEGIERVLEGRSADIWRQGRDRTVFTPNQVGDKDRKTKPEETQPEIDERALDWRSGCAGLFIEHLGQVHHVDQLIGRLESRRCKHLVPPVAGLSLPQKSLAP